MSHFHEPAQMGSSLSAKVLSSNPGCSYLPGWKHLCVIYLHKCYARIKMYVHAKLITIANLQTLLKHRANACSVFFCSGFNFIPIIIIMSIRRVRLVFKPVFTDVLFSLKRNKTQQYFCFRMALGLEIYSTIIGS
jgi:hypothetical protein